MIPQNNNTELNTAGFWVTVERHEVMQSVLDTDSAYTATVFNWSTGVSNEYPRRVVAGWHPVPDEVIERLLRDAGLSAVRAKLWHLGARFILEGFEVFRGKIRWDSDVTDLRLIMPDSIISVDSLRRAILEQHGEEEARVLFARAANIAFHDAGQAPDVKDA